MPPSTRFLAAALDAHRRGFHVWPAAPSGKSPLVASYAGDPDFGASTEDEIRELPWEHGVCVMLGPGQYVLDADSLVTAQDLRDGWGRDTLRVATRRGVHAYFTLPPGVLLRQGRQVLGLWDGKGLAATGSRTVALWAAPDGRKVEHDVQPQAMPAVLQRMVGEARPRRRVDVCEHSVSEREFLEAMAADGRPSKAFTVSLLLAVWERIDRALEHERVWGDVYYRQAAFAVRDCVPEGVPWGAIRDALIEHFDERDVLRENPQRGYMSIDNGMAEGLRDLIAEAG